MTKKKKFIKITTRDNLCSFYNELQTVMNESFKDFKRKPNKREVKKVCKPVLDKWEKIFEGIIKNYTLYLKMVRNQKGIWKAYK